MFSMNVPTNAPNWCSQILLALPPRDREFPKDVPTQCGIKGCKALMELPHS